MLKWKCYLNNFEAMETEHRGAKAGSKRVFGVEGV